MSKMKRIAIVGSVGIPANYGGFETLTENLVEELSDSNEITVFCSGRTYKRAERKPFFKNAKLKYVPLKANGFQSVLYDYISIIRALFVADTILILGVSGCTILPLIRLFTRKKIIVNIDGLEWRRQKWNRVARWFLRLSEGFAIRYSHAHVADNKAIQRYTAMNYGSVGHVIAYGGNQSRDTANDTELSKKYRYLKEDYCVKVARIEPENNIEMVIKAFIKLDDRLVLVGNWMNSEYGKVLYAKYRSHENIHLLHPIYEAKEIDFLRSKAKVYIHGHEAGGTNPSLVEAMCLGLPVLAYDVSFNHQTTRSMANYFQDSDDLVQFIRCLSAPHLYLNSQAMFAIAKKEYTWSIIADQYQKLIHEVLAGSSKKKVIQKIDRLDRMKLRTDDFEKMIRAYRLKF